MNASKPLTNLQLELLQTFRYELSEAQLVEIRDLLTRYFAEKVSDEIDALFEANDWGDETIEAWSEEHMRTRAKGGGIQGKRNPS